eukprot:UN13101
MNNKSIQVYFNKDLLKSDKVIVKPYNYTYMMSGTAIQTGGNVTNVQDLGGKWMYANITKGVTDRSFTILVPDRMNATDITAVAYMDKQKCCGTMNLDWFPLSSRKIVQLNRQQIDSTTHR